MSIGKNLDSSQLTHKINDLLSYASCGLPLMSYSRWMNSQFYTYWCSSKAERKEDEIFMCHYSLFGEEGEYPPDSESWTWEELVEILNSGIKIDHLSEEEMSELSSYMKQFVDDVNKKYGEPKQQWTDERQKM